MSVTYHQMLPSREYGGAAEVAFRLLQDSLGRLSDARQACLWLPGEGRAWEKAQDAGYQTRLYQQPDIVHDSRSSLMLTNMKLGMQLRSFRPGIVHVHSTELYGGLPWACALSGLRRVVHVHSVQEEATVRWALKRSPELVITCANFLVENVRRYLTPAQQEQLPIVAVPNCIDTEAYSPSQDRQAAKIAVDARPEVPLLLMLANLAPNKGQTTALRAVALLKHRGVDVDCWLAGIERGGGEAYKQELRRLIGELGIEDRVRLLGFRTDGPELLRAADFFLLPSAGEGLPLSVLEAQAAGVPVLAAPTGGTPEVVQDGRTGFLIAVDDAAGYAERIAQLLREPALREEITEQALRQVRAKHHVAAYCQKIWDLYQGLLKQRGSKAIRKTAMI